MIVENAPTQRERELANELRDAEAEVDSLREQLCDAEDDASNAKGEGEEIATHHALELCRDIERGVLTLAEVLRKLEES